MKERTALASKVFHSLHHWKRCWWTRHVTDPDTACSDPFPLSFFRLILIATTWSSCISPSVFHEFHSTCHLHKGLVSLQCLLFLAPVAAQPGSERSFWAPRSNSEPRAAGRTAAGSARRMCDSGLIYLGRKDGCFPHSPLRAFLLPARTWRFSFHDWGDENCVQKMRKLSWA